MICCLRSSQRRDARRRRHEVATDIANRAISLLEDAIEADQIQWPEMDAAVRFAAMDVAGRSDRVFFSDQVPINDS